MLERRAGQVLELMSEREPAQVLERMSERNRRRHWRYCWGSGYARVGFPAFVPLSPPRAVRYAWTERDQGEQGCKRSHENSHKTLFFRLN